jgi:hypothetical protein
MQASYGKHTRTRGGYEQEDAKYRLSPDDHIGKQIIQKPLHHPIDANKYTFRGTTVNPYTGTEEDVYDRRSLHYEDSFRPGKWKPGVVSKLGKFGDAQARAITRSQPRNWGRKTGVYSFSEWTRGPNIPHNPEEIRPNYLRKHPIDLSSYAHPSTRRPNPLERIPKDPQNFQPYRIDPAPYYVYDENADIGQIASPYSVYGRKPRHPFKGQYVGTTEQREHAKKTLKEYKHSTLYEDTPYQTDTPYYDRWMMPTDYQKGYARYQQTHVKPTEAKDPLHAYVLAEKNASSSRTRTGTRTNVDKYARGSFPNEGGHPYREKNDSDNDDNDDDTSVYYVRAKLRSCCSRISTPTMAVQKSFERKPTHLSVDKTSSNVDLLCHVSPEDDQNKIEEQLDNRDDDLCEDFLKVKYCPSSLSRSNSRSNDNGKPSEKKRNKSDHVFSSFLSSTIMATTSFDMPVTVRAKQRTDDEDTHQPHPSSSKEQETNVNVAAGTSTLRPVGNVYSSGRGRMPRAARHHDPSYSSHNNDNSDENGPYPPLPLSPTRQFTQSGTDVLRVPEGWSDAVIPAESPSSMISDEQHGPDNSPHNHHPSYVNAPYSRHMAKMHQTGYAKLDHTANPPTAYMNPLVNDRGFAADAYHAGHFAHGHHQENENSVRAPFHQRSYSPPPINSQHQYDHNMREMNRETRLTKERMFHSHSTLPPNKPYTKDPAYNNPWNLNPLSNRRVYVGEEWRSDPELHDQAMVADVDTGIRNDVESFSDWERYQRQMVDARQRVAEEQFRTGEWARPVGSTGQPTELRKMQSRQRVAANAPVDPVLPQKMNEFDDSSPATNEYTLPDHVVRSIANYGPVQSADPDNRPSSTIRYAPNDKLTGYAKNPFKHLTDLGKQLRQQLGDRAYQAAMERVHKTAQYQGQIANALSSHLPPSESQQLHTAIMKTPPSQLAFLHSWIPLLQGLQNTKQGGTAHLGMEVGRQQALARSLGKEIIQLGGPDATEHASAMNQIGLHKHTLQRSHHPSDWTARASGAYRGENDVADPTKKMSPVQSTATQNSGAFQAIQSQLRRQNNGDAHIANQGYTSHPDEHTLEENRYPGVSEYTRDANAQQALLAKERQNASHAPHVSAHSITKKSPHSFQPEAYLQNTLQNLPAEQQNAMNAMAHIFQRYQSMYPQYFNPSYYALSAASVAGNGGTESEEKNAAKKHAPSVYTNAALQQFSPLYQEENRTSNERIAQAGQRLREATHLFRQGQEYAQNSTTNLHPHEGIESAQAAHYLQRQQNATEHPQKHPPNMPVDLNNPDKTQGAAVPLHPHSGVTNQQAAQYLQRQQRASQSSQKLPYEHLRQGASGAVSTEPPAKYRRQLGRELLETFWANQPQLHTLYTRSAHLGRAMARELQPYMASYGSDAAQQQRESNKKTLLRTSHDLLGSLATHLMHAKQHYPFQQSSASQAAHMVMNVLTPTGSARSSDDLGSRMQSLQYSLQSPHLLSTLGRILQQQQNMSQPSHHVSQQAAATSHRKQNEEQEVPAGTSDIHLKNMQQYQAQNAGRIFLMQRGAQLASEAIRRYHPGAGKDDNNRKLNLENATEQQRNTLWAQVVRPFMESFYRPLMATERLQQGGISSADPSYLRQKTQSETSATGANGQNLEYIASLPQRIQQQATKTTLPSQIQTQVRTQGGGTAAQLEAQRIIQQHPLLQQTLSHFAVQLGHQADRQIDGIPSTELASAAGVYKGDGGPAAVTSHNDQLLYTTPELSSEKLPRGPRAKYWANRAFSQLLTASEREKVFGMPQEERYQYPLVHSPPWEKETWNQAHEQATQGDATRTQPNVVRHMYKPESPPSLPQTDRPRSHKTSTHTPLLAQPFR